MRSPENPGKAKSLARDIFTVPNAMTLARLALSPWAYRTAAGKPGENFDWFKIGLVSATDLEGNAARLEKNKRFGKFFAKLGFRTSEIGRNGDPIADTAYGLGVMLGGMKSRSIPRSLAALSIAQKLTKSAITVHATLIKKETLEVTNTGKAGEALTSFASYGSIAAEAIDNPEHKHEAKISSAAGIVGGIALSTLATVVYANDAGYIHTPRLYSFAQSVDEKLNRFIPGK